MIDEQTKESVCKSIAAHLGLNFPVTHWTDLERGIKSSCHELGVKTAESFISMMLSAQLPAGYLEVLATHLTIGETYFFRETPGLNAFSNHILPALVEQRRDKEQEIRIWSAGCCSGEEPYTIAILIYESIPDPENWKISILATDINRNFLEKAINGVYSSWSFRDTAPRIMEKYFTASGKDYRIHSHIQKMVGFSYMNLVEDNYPSAASKTDRLDIIFCRNVLMYFTPDQISRVSHRFCQSLKENGWLITSPVEVSSVYFPQFSQVYNSEAILLRKQKAEKRGILDHVFTRSKSFQQVSKPPSTEVGKTKKTNQKKATGAAKTAIPETTVIPKTSLKDEAEALYRSGRYQHVIALLKDLDGTSQSDPEIIMLKSRALANLGLLDQARQCMDQLSEVSHLGSGYYYLLATILQESMEADLAEQALKRALYLDPHHIMARFRLGNLARSKGEMQQARRQFKGIKEILIAMPEEEIIADSDGLTAGRLMDICNQLK